MLFIAGISIIIALWVGDRYHAIQMTQEALWYWSFIIFFGTALLAMVSTRTRRCEHN